MTEEDEKSFGELFEIYLKRSRYLKTALAEKLNVVVSTVSHWGDRNIPENSTLLKLAEILELSTEEQITFFAKAGRDELVELVQLRSQVSSTSTIKPRQSPQGSPLEWKSFAQQADWRNPQVNAFITRSNTDLFAIDSAIVSWFCPDYGSDWGWKSDEDIELTLDPRLIDPELPEELKIVSQTYNAQHPNKKDSVRYCVVEFSSQPRDSGGRLLLTVRPVTYLTSFPIANVLLIAANDYLRTNWFHKLENRSHPLVPNMLIAHVLVVTGDNQLILQRRRSDRELDYFRGYWSASFEEHLNGPWEPYLSADRVFKKAFDHHDPTIFSGLHRAVAEELQLSEPEMNNTVIRLLAVGFEHTNFNTALYAMATLPRDLVADKLEERLPSGEEHDLVAHCPFDVETLRPTLLNSSPPPTLADLIKGEPTWKWHPTARMRVYLGLRQRYGLIDLQSKLAAETTN